MTFGRRIRRLVDLWPSLGRGVRDIRDYINERHDQAVDTGLGFRCAGNVAMQSATFEVNETQFVLRELSNADLFVDVGANIGYYTCLALAHGLPVVAFEPSSRNVRRLLRNVEANDFTNNVEVIPVALSNAAGVLKLFGRNTGASLVSDWSGASVVDYELVPVNTLDAMLGSRLRGRRTLIKVDVEGAEFGMLQGAQSVLTASPKPTWLMEICLDENRADGVNPNFGEIFTLFWQSGYEAYTLESELRKVSVADVKSWVDHGKRTFGSYNFVFRDQELLGQH